MGGPSFLYPRPRPGCARMRRRDAPAGKPDQLRAKSFDLIEVEPRRSVGTEKLLYSGQSLLPGNLSSMPSLLAPKSSDSRRHVRPGVKFIICHLAPKVVLKPVWGGWDCGLLTLCCGGSMSLWVLPAVPG